MDVIAELQAHPLFASLGPEELAEAGRAGQAIQYSPGDYCIREGEAGEIFGVLLSGQLEASHARGAIGRQRLGTIEPGEVFGEMSLLTGNPASADVIALEPSRAVIFLQEAISPVIAMSSQAVRFLTRLMAQRLAAPAERSAPPRPASVRLCLGASTPARVLSISTRCGDLRYAYFDTSSEKAQAGGTVRGLGGDRAELVGWGTAGEIHRDVASGAHEAAVEAVLQTLTAPVGGPLSSLADLSVVGHRVCHGGTQFNGPAVIDDDVCRHIAQLAELAPMDNPYNLAAIQACRRLLPGLPQVAVFDTAFSLKMPPAAWTYALPAGLADPHTLRRFGFHGISHESAARAACEHLQVNFDSVKILSCHLGTTASIIAIDHGRPIDHSMGLTPLDGLVMSTRPGDLDVGLLLHLIADRGLDPCLLRSSLYEQAGLLGLSGVSCDVQTVLEAADAGNARALLAIQVFCHRARRYLGAGVALLGGVDVLVFTGGVGQNAAGVRARICQDLHHMGIRLDEDRNRSARVEPAQVAEIAHSHSLARVVVVGSDEEHTIARQSVRALAQQRTTQVIRRRNTPIPISLSAHHVHLTQPHVEALFGPGRTLTWMADLSQPGQFSCQEQLSLLGPKGRIDRVRVLGPVRPESQVEIARTEEFKLGLDAPIRMSGDLAGTPGITLEGPAGRVVLDHGVICAMRHIHMSPQEAMEFAVRDRDVVRIRVEGERSLIFGDVRVRVHPDFRLDMHIDTDEANAAELQNNATGVLDSIQERA